MTRRGSREECAPLQPVSNHLNSVRCHLDLVAPTTEITQTHTGPLLSTDSATRAPRYGRRDSAQSAHTRYEDAVKRTLLIPHPTPLTSFSGICASLHSKKDTRQLALSVLTLCRDLRLNACSRTPRQPSGTTNVLQTCTIGVSVWFSMTKGPDPLA